MSIAREEEQGRQSRIHLLSEEVINKIAAGEVVENPLSIVRELVDNSVDAGADEISINLDNGGQRLIKVVDNGCGMSKEEVVLAFDRHATSKIETASDLLKITTLGFRGEALSSIAAVASVYLRSCLKGERLGTEIEIEGGVIKSVKETASPEGTLVAVRNLFFNMPARLKFLKSPQTEQRRILHWLKGFSLAYPDIRFKLTASNREILLLERVSSSIERAKKIFKGQLISFKREFWGVFVEGALSHPENAGRTSSDLYILVNGRVVSDRLIAKAVKTAFGIALKKGEYPVGFISLRVSSEEVDVNVHPQKLEVRFSDSSKIFKVVYAAVSSAIKELNVVEDFGRASYLTYEAEQASIKEGAEESEIKQEDFAGKKDTPFIPFRDKRGEARKILAVKGVLNKSLGEREVRFVGQFFKCFLLFEDNACVYFVDMHAAHERIVFNSVIKRFLEGRVKSQQLAIPISLTLSPGEYQRLLGNLDAVSKAGFLIEDFGDCTVLIRGVPIYLKGGKIKEAVKELASFEDEIRSEVVTKVVAERLAATIACHSSIRSGKILREDEALSLWRQLLEAETSGACPHGRSTIVTFKKEEIEKWFSRR